MKIKSGESFKGHGLDQLLSTQSTENTLWRGETRRKSYDTILPKVSDRKKLILQTLDHPMTAHEITIILLMQKHIPYYDRNFVSPRLTELKKDGVLHVVGKKWCRRTERTVAIWERRKHDQINAKGS